MYDPMMVAPMRDELVTAGFRSLRSAQEVDDVLSKTDETTLVVVNSVCGCAAANARPGAIRALKHTKLPDNVTTVFAGVDRDATEKARGYFRGYMPSSPSIALMKGGECVFIPQRHEIEGRDPAQIAAKITQAFDAHCG